MINPISKTPTPRVVERIAPVLADNVIRAGAAPNNRDCFENQNVSLVYSNYNAAAKYYDIRTTEYVFTKPGKDIEDVPAMRKELERVEAEGENIDYSQMTSKEIYVFEFNRYAEVFGKDFMDDDWEQFCIIPNISEDDREVRAVKSEIKNSFVDAERYRMIKNFASKDECIEAEYEGFAECHGYGGLTDEEIYNKVIAEFNMSGGTYADGFKMMLLLGRMGLEDFGDAFNAASALSSLQSDTHQKLSLSQEYWAQYANKLYAYDTTFDFDDVVSYLEHMYKLTQKAIGGSEEVRNIVLSDYAAAMNLLKSIVQRCGGI